MRYEIAARRIQDTNYLPSTVLSLPFPKDGIFTGCNLEFHGSVVNTFSSGTPVIVAESTIDPLIPVIGLNVAGRQIKTVRPHMLHAFEILAFGQEGRRTSSAGSSAVTNDLPTTDGGFAGGTTTQVTTVRETLRIPFQMDLARIGKEKTWLNLNGVPSAEMKFYTGPFNNLDSSNGANDAWTSNTFIIEAHLEEVIGFANTKEPFADFQQLFSQDASITAAVTDKAFDCPTGGLLAGILIYQKNGASPSVAADLGITTYRVMSGNKIYREGDWNAEQDRMRQSFRCNAARASAKSRLDGIGYLNLMANDRDLNTAVDARNLQSLKLKLTTHASASYTLNLNFEFHNIVLPN